VRPKVTGFVQAINSKAQPLSGASTSAPVWPTVSCSGRGAATSSPAVIAVASACTVAWLVGALLVLRIQPARANQRMLAGLVE
jgi:hypothetical protein